MKKRMNTMYELTEQKKNDISVYGVKYGDLQIDDISTDKGRVKKFVDDINKYQLSPIHLGDVVVDFVESV
jgi:gas vesicle protein